MVAGVCALLLETDAQLTPEDVKHILQHTATGIVTGTSAMGEAAKANRLMDEERTERGPFAQLPFPPIRRLLLLIGCRWRTNWSLVPRTAWEATIEPPKKGQAMFAYV